MQGKACAFVIVAAMLAGCADAPSRQAGTPAAREKAAAVVPQQAARTIAADVGHKPHTHASRNDKKRSVPVKKRGDQAGDDAVYVTLTTTWSEAPTRTADNGGSSALPALRSGQREGVFAGPVAASGLEDPIVF